MKNENLLAKKIVKAFSTPRATMRFILSLLRGMIFCLKIKLYAPQNRIGARFRALSGLDIRGPGKVIIGDDVTVASNFLRVPSIITHTKESCVIIGDGTCLGGTRISCVTQIKIGRNGLLGCATIIDSDVIPLEYMTIEKQWQENHAKPILIGSSCWVGTNACILKGAELGDECVLGAGGVIYDQQFPDRSLLLGNPARRVGSTR